MAFILLDAVMFHGQNIWHFMSGREYVKKKEKSSDNTVLIKSCFARLEKNALSSIETSGSEFDKYQRNISHRSKMEIRLKLVLIGVL